MDALKSGSTDVTQVAVADGMAGVGKTAFATHVAHRLADDYRDGQFYANLRDHTPGLTPPDAAEVLRTLLVSLGIPGKSIPEDPDARAAMWRSELSGRRTITFLDNHTTALELARASGYRPEQARAHRGLNLTLQALGHCEAAREHGAKAAELFAELGVPAPDQEP